MARKGLKKTGLRRQIRKTLGALLLASSLAVAAVPVEYLQADEAAKVTLSDTNSNVPIVSEAETIYSTGDGRFQFAYVQPTSTTPNKVAVILGYNSGALAGNALTIPDTVDAYSKYSDNYGSVVGYVAVGKSGNFLFYREEEKALAEDGSETLKVNFYPCYYETRAKWENLELDAFYYLPGGAVASSGDVNSFARTADSNVQRIKSATVEYIGNQYLTTDPEGKWTIGGRVTTPDKGIFAGNGNIVTLTVGSNLRGIGNYAFYGCTGLAGISLGNGLNTVGNYAFANCLNIKNINLDLYSSLQIIGDHAFYNCQGLTSFRMPIQVSQVGDNAFENCFALKTVALVGSDYNVALNRLGNSVFKNCSSLESLTFPSTYGENEIPLSLVAGCSALQYVSVPGRETTFVEDTTTFADFKATVSEEFYFEGMAESALHKTSSRHALAFRYLDQDSYEIVIQDTSGHKAIYRVNSANQLIYFSLDEGMEEVRIPSTIGPYKITEINSTSFQNNCFLKKITIPSSITVIADGAFQGCHNLKDVIFLEPVKLTSIGKDAFKTQEVIYHKSSCDEELAESPTLTFTAPLDVNTEPFRYAFDSSSNINVGSQKRAYITFYSGWPTNLTLRYNPDTDKNELIDYPIFSDITKYTLTDYPYMTENYAKAAKEAAAKYLANPGSMTDYERQIVDSTLNLVLPEGVEGIANGLFIGKEAQESSLAGDKIAKTITAYGLEQVAPGSFEGCTNVEKISILGKTTAIGDYAFKDCTGLREAVLTETVENLGIRPFAGCVNLQKVDFGNSPYFHSEEGIVYGLTDGKRSRLMEVLESRGRSVGSSTIEIGEMAGMTEIMPEALRNVDGIGSVDLRQSRIREVPPDAFRDTDSLYSVYLPTTARSIGEGAFRDSSLQYIEIPSSVAYLDPDAFNTDKNSPQNNRKITFYAEADSNAAVYAGNYSNIIVSNKPVDLSYTVHFWDAQNNLLESQTVKAGADAIPPVAPEREGYTFLEWVPDYHAIGRDMDIMASYTAKDPEASKLTVTFLDYDDKVLKTVKVKAGENAEAPVDPVRDGYYFTGWRPAVTNIQADTTTYAQYEAKGTQHVVRFIDYNDTVIYTQKVNDGEDAIEPKSPVRDGYTFTSWRPAPVKVKADMDVYALYEKNSTAPTAVTPTTNLATTPAGSQGGSGSATTKTYTLSVVNGSGGGSFGAGTQVTVTANAPAAGASFSGWTVEPATVTVANKAQTTTVVTMPEANVTITANYTTTSTGGGTAGTAASAAQSAAGGNQTSPSSGRNRTSSGNQTGNGTGNTSVSVTKNGLSDTNVAAAVVNGSSDNYTIKIAESAEATAAIEKALTEEYGDLTNIKYVPMDISLYDSTGTNKITDTSGLSISITLPLPDSLRDYAGNNKAASVLNGKLDKLDAKFTTISGVPCITFKAEHFSPYAIYVDTANLKAGQSMDATPKTGDGIHPKWFLAMGMAALSLVLFMKKDKKPVKKVRVA